MLAKNDWVRKNFYASFERDFGRQFIKRHRLLILMYGKTKWNILGKFLCFIERIDFRIEYKHKIKRENYQPILEDHLRDIKRVWSKASLPPLVHIHGIHDISGFDIYNAESIPWFGENYISVNSGICYFSHTFARCLQPYFISIQNASKIPFFFSRYFQKKFRDTSVACLCQDHRYALAYMMLIPDDDNLLFGIEQFIIAHEIGHLMLKEYSYARLKYNKYFDKDTVCLIEKNEEIAADAFAIIILMNIKRFFSKSIYTLYGPRFIFKIYSLYEDAGLMTKTTNHPSYKSRYTYLANMINQVGYSPLYDEFDTMIEKIWDKNKNQIERRYRKIQKREAELFPILEHLYYRYNSH